VPAATSEAVATAVPPTIPALTPVTLEIEKVLSSKTSKRGDTFPLRLAEPIVIEGRTLVPAGAAGVGEVIEAKHGGMSGSSGVLILVADYITVGGRQLRLRSMHIAQAGADHRTAATVIGVTPFIGPLGLFVTGGETRVTSGTLAEAKTAESVTIEVSTIPDAPPLAVPSQEATADANP
jgi:hypothetical protein